MLKPDKLKLRNLIKLDNFNQLKLSVLYTSDFTIHLPGIVGLQIIIVRKVGLFSQYFIVYNNLIYMYHVCS